MDNLGSLLNDPYKLVYSSKINAREITHDARQGICLRIDGGRGGQRDGEKATPGIAPTGASWEQEDYGTGDRGVVCAHMHTRMHVHAQKEETHFLFLIVKEKGTRTNSLKKVSMFTLIVSMNLWNSLPLDV